eukprot:scaffold53913_cov67-Phaeocystis_antarctica.AAC.8
MRGARGGTQHARCARGVFDSYTGRKRTVSRVRLYTVCRAARRKSGIEGDMLSERRRTPARGW